MPIRNVPRNKSPKTNNPKASIGRNVSTRKCSIMLLRQFICCSIVLILDTILLCVVSTLTNVSPSILDRILRYYSDPECTKPVPRDEDGSMQLFLNATIQGRNSDVQTFWVRNEHTYPLQLQPYSSDPDLIFVTYPQAVLYPQQSAQVNIVFRCPLDRFTPLNAQWGFDIVIKSE